MPNDDKNDRTDWETTNKALSRHDVGQVLPDKAHSGSPLTDSEGNTPLIPQTMLAQFQAGGIERRAAVEQLKAWHAGKLEIAEHAITEAVRVKKAEATGMAEQLLAQLDMERTQFLRSLGMENTGARQEALTELSVQTTAMLRDAQSQDMPDAVKDMNIRGIMQLYERFFDKLLDELGS